jgi:RHS repeat-associated protein
MRAVSNGGISGDLPTETLYQAWFGQRLMQERRSSDNDRTRYYLWGNYIDELIQIQYYIATGGSSLPTNADYYPLQDNLYRGIALTDHEGNIVEAYDMDAYGNTLTFTAAGTGGNWWADNATQSDQIGNRIIYCGYMYDPETQLYYVRNRHYNPNLGRWIQRDPIGYDGGINLYEYINSQPSISTDPLGLAPTTSPSQCQCKCGVNGVVHLINKGWTIDTTKGNAYFTLEILIKFKTGNGYKPSCCRYIQFVQGTISINGTQLKAVTAGTPLDGRLHVDSNPYNGDNDTNPKGGGYENHSSNADEFLSYDTPGFIRGGLTKGTVIDWEMTFKGTVIDTCNKNRVLGYATQSFKESMKGTFPNLTTNP